MASTRERNGRFTGLYRTSDGQQKSAGTFSTKTAALKAAKAHEAVEANGQDAKTALSKPQKVYSTDKRGKVTVAGYAPQWLSTHRLEATSRESYGYMLKHIVRGLGNVILSELDHRTVLTFIRNLEASDMSGSTCGHVMTVLREMCKTAVAENILTSDPTANVKIADRRAKEMRILSKDEYKRIMAVIDPHFALLVQTLISTGLRWGECIALKSTDIIQETSGRWIIKVRRTVAEVNGVPFARNYGKTAKAMRDVSISADLAAQLIARDGEWVFTAHRGGQLSRSNFRRIWLNALKDSGVSGVRVHDMRHTHASWLVNDGVSLVVVRDRLGHTDLKTTSRYLHVMADDTDKALAALDRILAA